MSVLIRHKRTNVPGSEPQLSDLVLGELAINTHDGKLFTKIDNGVESIVSITFGSSSITNLDCGTPTSIYTINQNIDCGGV